MTQSEAYDLQTQRMTASQSNQKLFGRFDPIHIALAVTSVIFLILSIVFIILFATKHDGSSGFLATGFSQNKTDDVSSELKSLLKKKYTVNSFAVDVQNQAVSAVFSLRDSVSASDVQKTLSGSETVTQLETTYGDKATAVCRQQQVFGSTALPATSSKNPQTQTTAIPVSQLTTVTTQAPPATIRYCDNTAVNRDIIIVVDMNQLKKTNNDEKMKSLHDLRGKLVNGLIFPQANVLLKAVVADKVQDISNSWTNSVDQLNKDFDALFAVAGTTETLSLDFDTVLKNGIESFRKVKAYVPGAIFVVTDKPLNQVVNTKARESGIFVAVTGVGSNYIQKYDIYSDAIKSYDSWTDLSTADPFQTFVCQFYSLPEAPAMSRYAIPIEELDDVTNSSKCEVLDIIIAFDTSESLSRIILNQYVEFAQNFVAQYKFRNDDYTRVGIITFTDEANEILSLQSGNNLDIVSNTIGQVKYTGGLTDVTNALLKAKSLFDTESDNTRPSRVLIVLSDGVPTVDTYQDEINAGAQLKSIGVATFFVGYSSYNDDVKKELGQVTNPNYVFGDTSAASFKGITEQILVTYPCPVAKCVTAYYAVEISEATDAYVVKNLQDVLTISSKASTLQNATESYQLITYNDGAIHVFPQGDASLPKFQEAVQRIIDDANFRSSLRSGTTRLDTAINQISTELENQAKRNPRFSANILFFGQANDAVLYPDVSTEEKKAYLVAASSNLKAQTGQLIYVVDDSLDKDKFGEDLWPSVTTTDRIIKNSDNVEASLEKSDFFTTWGKLSCSLPPLQTCFDTQLDVAVIIDLQNKDYVFMNYITKLLAQFSAQDDAHFSLLAYGSRQTTVLSTLAAHSSQEIQDYSVLFEEWRNGSYFTTPAPSTSTQKPANFWTNDLYLVDQNTISGVFSALGTQFGCGNYNDNGDRLFAPNLYIFASDNFAAYTNNVWNDFQTQVHNRFGCYDCPGTPSFLFLSRTNAGADTTIGPTLFLSDTDLDIDYTDDTSTQANINKFNGIINSICTAAYPTCATYACVNSN
uniref:VWFA domain-containing protein n=2 Tax=Caenorhabditis japonica TaxID=281687 RepID=A0A8R1DPJ8_CAEJA